MTQEQQKFYNQGRQAREKGFPIQSCNVFPGKQYHFKASAWKAGWIDADIEAGNCVYWPDDVRRDAA